MRKWAVPLAVLGVGGVSALLFSEAGRRRLGLALQQTPQRWNDRAQSELDHLQQELDELSESVGAEPHTAR